MNRVPLLRDLEAQAEELELDVAVHTVPTDHGDATFLELYDTGESFHVDTDAGLYSLQAAISYQRYLRYNKE